MRHGEAPITPESRTLKLILILGGIYLVGIVALLLDLRPYFNSTNPTKVPAVGVGDPDLVSQTRGHLHDAFSGKADFSFTPAQANQAFAGVWQPSENGAQKKEVPQVYFHIVGDKLVVIIAYQIYENSPTDALYFNAILLFTPVASSTEKVDPRLGPRLELTKVQHGDKSELSAGKRQRFKHLMNAALLTVLAEQENASISDEPEEASAGYGRMTGNNLDDIRIHMNKGVIHLRRPETRWKEQPTP